LTQGLDWEAFSEWQRLVAEWEAANAAYEEARQAGLDPALSPSDQARFEAEAAAADELRAALKERMDAMIKSRGAERPPLGDEYVVLTTDAEEEADTPDPKEARPTGG
jgi:hypothetical protein